MLTVPLPEVETPRSTSDNTAQVKKWPPREDLNGQTPNKQERSQLDQCPWEERTWHGHEHTFDTEATILNLSHLR